MNYPKTIEQLIICFKKLPGIGAKTAERLALSLLNFDEETLNMFSDSIKNIKKNITRCSICNCLSENDICEICSNIDRNSNIICVLSDPKDIYLFEKMGKYNGKYFILNNLISPLKGINPENININELINLIEKNKIKEIVLALKPSIEGETTSLYLSKKLADLDVKVSKIAQGIPLGAEMEFIDSMTLELAFENRTKM